MKLRYLIPALLLHVLSALLLSGLGLLWHMFPAVVPELVHPGTWLLAFELALAAQAGLTALAWHFIYRPARNRCVPPDGAPTRWPASRILLFDVLGMLPALPLVAASLPLLAWAYNPPLFHRLAILALIMNLTWRVGLAAQIGGMPRLRAAMFDLLLGTAVAAVFLGLRARSNSDLLSYPQWLVLFQGSLILLAVIYGIVPRIWSRAPLRLVCVISIMLILMLTGRMNLNLFTGETLPLPVSLGLPKSAPPPPLKSWKMEGGDWGQLTLNQVSKDGVQWVMGSPVEASFHVPANATVKASLAVPPAIQPSTRHGLRFIVERVDNQQRLLDRLLDPPRIASDVGWVAVEMPLGNSDAQVIQIRLTLAEGEPLFEHGKTPKPSAASQLVAWMADWRIVPQAAPANVIVLLSDALRRDGLGIYGNPFDPSPVIDSWANEAVVFDEAYSLSSWTLPSVASMMTSLYPRQHGIHTDWSRALRPETQTLASILASSGFSTAGFMGNPTAGHMAGLNHGFGVYDESCTLNFTQANSECVVEAFLDWQDQHAGEPFFAYLHWMDTHTPYKIRENDYLMDRLGRLNHPRLSQQGMGQDSPAVGMSPWAYSMDRPTADLILKRFDENIGVWNMSDGPYRDNFTSSEMAVIRAYYDAKIREMDGSFHAFREALERRGLGFNTYVILLSDHGEEFGEHGGYLHGRTLYQEMVHIPLLMSGPGLPAQHFGRRMTLLDLAPTLLGLLEVEAPEVLEGRDLSGLLKGENPEPLPEEDVYVELNPGAASGASALLQGPYKIILGTEPGLFNLERDPLERSDGQTEAPVLHQFLSERLSGRQKAIDLRSPANPTTQPAHLDSAAREKLKQLGYLR